MNPLADLGRTLGFALGAGVNLYATVAMIGLAQRLHWVTLPPQYAVFDDDAVIATALVLYAVEFFADKIPWVDSLWDALHAVIRPVGAAFIAVAGLGDASPQARVLAALLGGAVAAGSHAAKAGTRAVVNLSPEPFSNWMLSFGEDAFVIGLTLLVFQYPIAAAVVTVLILHVIAVGIFLLTRRLRRWWRSDADPVSSAPGR